MAFSRQFILGLLITSASVSAADIFISRKPEEPDFLVQNCELQPTLTCTGSARMSGRELKRLEKKLYWLRFRQNLYVVMGSDPYRATPGFMYQGLATYTYALNGVTTLRHSPDGGLVRVPKTAPGARFVAEIVDAAIADVQAPKSDANNDSLPTKSPESANVPTS